MNELRFLSPERLAEDGSRCGKTVVIAEFPGRVRERQPWEPIHHKKRLGQTRCLICHEGGEGVFLVWHRSASNHSEHPARCA